MVAVEPPPEVELSLREIVATMLPTHGEFDLGIEVDRITNRLLTEHVQEVEHFAEAITRVWVRTYAREKLRNRRSILLAQSRATRLEEMAAGQGALDLTYPVSGVWKPLRSMTAFDCRTVAERYQASARVEAFRARFFLALAEQVQAAGAETVEEVMGEEQIQQLLDSLPK